ncbi:hypothetical protein OKW24_004705 [Peribacillus simplex]|uniref:hypothetical protein n=1 Tax=Peribacillus simplex TaxID=1478 RepID=UPI0024E1B3C6|nr:hypothetical protein [Peribacillus simplex]MDF9762932.1 hypothetical protein [Peribacillus simplex]
MDFIKTREKLAKEINIYVKSSNEKEALAQSRNGYEVRGEMFGILPVFGISGYLSLELGVY